MVVAEVSIFPLGTGSPGVGRDVEGRSAEDMVRSVREGS